ncbi:YbcC family protein [Aestuariispira insulae]|uniref:Probable inorganic carbon transporter subunit DabA n=1 Tax=Aestuariispira insulae TaxID=1461337 RepID=A0A3D9HI91_9PROT|nr:DUF2309 domain-containing protein [Aestuariispira insulae]RED49145.1 hypothetical protein DFP90_106122 [Aestuariispira insulae]
MFDSVNLPPRAMAACLRAAEEAGRAIPPMWPLSSSVAVNPYLGQTQVDLTMAGARLGRVAGARVAMPRSWYARQWAEGQIRDDDLEKARLASVLEEKPKTLEILKAAMRQESEAPRAVPTMAELATAHLDIECTELVAERIGAWAASYFDAGQAMWSAPKEGGAYHQWRAFASRDLTPGILGIQGFAPHVDEAPQTAAGAITRAVERLGLQEAELPTYFHRLLMSLGGWAQLARYELWQAELEGDRSTVLIDLLAIRLVWEEALFELCGDAIAGEWLAARAAHAAPLQPNQDLVIDVIFQEAAEIAAQRRLGETLAAPTSPKQETRPDLIAAFCIDVRSEVFRRALENMDPKIRTMGFAGFFGLPALHHGFASDEAERRLPVLLSPALESRDQTDEASDLKARYLARAKRAWGRFKLAAVSSFAFVEAAGPLYLVKLCKDSIFGAAGVKTVSPCPVFDPMPDLETRLAIAEKVLRAMSLTTEFASVVLLAGHGATVENNPHASALNCGACGGHAGDVSARLLAGLLNQSDVRAGLVGKGIEIPADTVFVAALHDSTTDKVTLFNDFGGKASGEQLVKVQAWLDGAAKASRAERMLRLPGAKTEKDLLKRSRDWSEIRPEWALARCSAFIAAPRQKTAGKKLDGSAFLHDYDWRADDGFSVLELIMTAPVVVASWISLQYYGSTVSPRVFGGGNKLLHNVTGGIGVVEGNGGSLRAGLPWQSVHDGSRFIHDPLRLTVCIEAPRDAMNRILKQHEDVKALFDNGWLHLFALDDQGHMVWRYDRDLSWEPVKDQPATSQSAAA